MKINKVSIDEVTARFTNKCKLFFHFNLKRKLDHVDEYLIHFVEGYLWVLLIIKMEFQEMNHIKLGKFSFLRVLYETIKTN